MTGSFWLVLRFSALVGALLVFAVRIAFSQGADELLIILGHLAGPGLVNFGRALVNTDGQLSATALWLVAVATGGLLA